MYDIYYNFVHISGIVENVKEINQTTAEVEVKTISGQDRTIINILCKDDLAIKALLLTSKNIVDIKGYIKDNKIIAKSLYVKDYKIVRKKDKVLLQNRLKDIKEFLTFDKVEEWLE